VDGAKCFVDVYLQSRGGLLMEVSRAGQSGAASSVLSIFDRVSTAQGYEPFPLKLSIKIALDSCENIVF
jgi:hypothetical protein